VLSYEQAPVCLDPALLLFGGWASGWRGTGYGEAGKAYQVDSLGHLHSTVRNL
jgi:hypothetical protein